MYYIIKYLDEEDSKQEERLFLQDSVILNLQYFEEEVDNYILEINKS